MLIVLLIVLGVKKNTSVYAGVRYGVKHKIDTLLT